jgi:cytochrome P450
MTGSLTHQNPSIFPDPHTFNPERWLVGSEADRKRLEGYLVPFSKGPRICLGMNLAMAELYLILAMVFRRFEFDTTLVKRERDVDVSFSFVVAAQARESPGLEVTVHSAE